jgi:serine/threonine-protein kinase
MDGTPFGHYRLIEMLGRGGMGEVWRAYDTETKRTVAIKVLPPYLADDHEFVQRFRREAEAAAQLNSPHVIPIHRYGEIDGRLYVDMRLIAGRDLGTVLAEGPLEPARAVRIIDQVAKALHAAHKVGLIHRDIKPSNILLDDDDFAYLIDFGIARAADDTRMTKSGSTIGTFAYIAPERLNASGKEDARVDIYSLACVLYESLTGEPPFTGDTMPRLIVAHLSEPPPRPSITGPDVPAQMDEVIATGMAKDPDQRYATTVELADAARDAITVPIHRPAPSPAQLAATEQDRNSVTAEPPASPIPWPAVAYDQRPQPPPSPWSRSAAQSGPQSTGYYAPQSASPAAHEQAGDSTFAATKQADGPTLPPPLADSSTGDQRNRSRRQIALAGGAAAIATAIAVVLVLVFTNGNERPNRPPAGATSTAPPPNTGPFTGVYRADFGPSATYGKPDPGATPSTGQWAVRSVCLSTGCVATATATGGPTLQSAFVFDDIGGQWHAVNAASVASPPPGVTGFNGCQFPAEYWTVITLQPRPDGTVGGQYSANGPNECQTERTVTFTRIGDVDLNSLPDPASQPVRVASPAEAFHGHYRETQTPDSSHWKTQTWDKPAVRTDCLRTGERCISNAGDVYIFADGKWTYNFDGTGGCNGGPAPTKRHWELPLPQPPQDPITLLTGHGHADITAGACASSYNEEVKFERTGD